MLKSEDVVTIVKDEKMTTPLNKIGRNMDKHLLKRKDNPAIRINIKEVVNPAWSPINVFREAVLEAPAPHPIKVTFEPPVPEVTPPVLLLMA